VDKIGVVTVTYNSANVVGDFIDCFLKQTYQNLVLYVVDNCSEDITLSILKKQDISNIVIIDNKTNFGVAKANNQAINRAFRDDCNQVLLINNDVTFEKGLVHKLIKSQKENNCSLVVPKIMYFKDPDTIWYAGSWFIKNKGYLPLHRGQKQVDNGQFNQSIEVEYAPTCCLLAKRKVFDDIGLMNEKYFVYFDDTDFSYRIWKDGRHKMFYCPDIKFYHKVGSLTKSIDFDGKKNYRGNFFIEQNVANHIYFLRQIGSVFAYLFIIWLFFKNNFRFIVDAQIRKDFSTWWLINKSYIKGIRM